MRRLMTILCVMALTASVAVAKDLRTVIFKVEQMVCENCEKKVLKNIRYEKGVKKVETNVPANTVTITYDAEKTSVEELQKGFMKFKYNAVEMKPCQACAAKKGCSEQGNGSCGEKKEGCGEKKGCCKQGSGTCDNKEAKAEKAPCCKE